MAIRHINSANSSITICTVALFSLAKDGEIDFRNYGPILNYGSRNLGTGTAVSPIGGITAICRLRHLAGCQRHLVFGSSRQVVTISRSAFEHGSGGLCIGDSTKSGAVTHVRFHTASSKVPFIDTAVCRVSFVVAGAEAIPICPASLWAVITTDLLCRGSMASVFSRSKGRSNEKRPPHLIPLTGRWWSIRSRNAGSSTVPVTGGICRMTTY